MTPADAVDVVAVLRTMYPDGDAPPELLASYASVLSVYDHSAALLGVDRLMHTYKSRRLPTIAVIEDAFHDVDPAAVAWHSVDAALAVRANTPPDLPDEAARMACARLGGWSVLLEWDGSTQLLRDSFIGEYRHVQQEAERAASTRPRLGTGERKALNLTSDEPCAYCEDSGSVTLTGSVTDGGVVYERGVTACRWCEIGEAVYRSVTSGHGKGRNYVRPQRITSDYAVGDLASRPVSEGERVTKEEYAASPVGQADPALRDDRVWRMLDVGVRS